jgi:hypothetical protein
MLQPRRRTARLLLPVLAMLGVALVPASTAWGAETRAHVAPGESKAAFTPKFSPFTLAEGDPVLSASAANFDLPSQALALAHDTRYVGIDTTGAGDGAAGGEPQITCNTSGGARVLAQTVWVRFKGTGGSVILDTLGATFDTLIFAYQGTTPTQAGALVCADDRPQGSDPPEVYLDARLVLPTVAGRDYLVAIGGCKACGTTESGNLALSYVTGDQRAHPAVLPAGNSDASLFGATVEAGENLQCQGFGFGTTAWYRINLKEPGTIKFSPVGSGFRPVVTLYRAGSVAPFPGCVVGSNADPSLVTYSRALTKGSYDLQVGAVGSLGTYYPYSFSFSVDPDEDNDGWNRAPYNGTRRADCQDTVFAVNPAAKDVRGGGNQDCDQYTDEDADGDNKDADWAGGPDCYPDDPRFPTKREVRGNDRDENCDGKVVYYTFVGVRVQPQSDAGDRFDHFRISPVPKGATVRIKCKGGGCPAKDFRKKFARKRGVYDAVKYAKRIKLSRSTVVETRVTRRFTIGKYVKFFFRSDGTADKKELCVYPGKSRPGKKCE